MPAKRVSPTAILPEGFLYQPDFLAEEEEAELIQVFQSLPFQSYDFRGYTAKRRVARFGVNYDLTTRKASPITPVPEFLLAVRERAAAIAGIFPESLVQVMVTEYPPGAPIGWHRDSPQYETIIGVSLASPARMRLKPYQGDAKAVSVTLEPRSVYAMRGSARWRFQHSIPAVQHLRYSITLRSLRENHSH